MDSIQSATSSGVQLKHAGTGLQPETSSHLPLSDSVRKSDRLLSKPGVIVYLSSPVTSVGPKNSSPVSFGSSAGTFSQLPEQKYLMFSGEAMSKHSYRLVVVSGFNL